jgi:hypothetical protein
MTADVSSADGKTARVLWTIGKSEFSEHNGVLPGLFNRAAEFDGMAVGIAGASMLQIARNQFNLKNSVQLAMAQDASSRIRILLLRTLLLIRAMPLLAKSRVCRYRQIL